jgi:hypothetical protein
MSQNQPSNLRKVYELFVKFSFAGLLLGVGLLSFLVLGVVSRLESLAPAEFHLLLELLKNRFYR